MLSPRYVDTREQSRIAPLERAGFEPRKLDAGDVSFPEYGGGTVGQENKRVYQLVDDMVSGQLARQAQKMIDTYKYPILSIEGHWTRDPKTDLLVGTEGQRVAWGQLWNQLMSLQCYGLLIDISTSPEHTIARTLELAELFSKAYHPSLQRNLGGDVRVAVLSFIEGMGSKKSEALLESMPTLAEVAGASEQEIRDVDGFGPVQAKRIYDFWR